MVFNAGAIIGHGKSDIGRVGMLDQGYVETQFFVRVMTPILFIQCVTAVGDDIEKHLLNL